MTDDRVGSNTSPTPLIVAVGAPALRRWRLATTLVLVVPCKLALERVVKLLVQRERPGPRSATRSCAGCTRAG
jgi:hypothetical protein